MISAALTAELRAQNTANTLQRNDLLRCCRFCSVLLIRSGASFGAHIPIPERSGVPSPLPGQVRIVAGMEASRPSRANLNPNSA